MEEMNGMLHESVERLAAAAALLEKAAAWFEERGASVTSDVAKITATVDAEAAVQRCEALEKKLAEAEKQIAEMRVQSAEAPIVAARAAAQKTEGLRKTLPVATQELLSKKGIHSVDGIEAGSLDEALTGLSLEQRIAVKAQLIRTGSLR
jgi:hypothetical protein